MNQKKSISLKRKPAVLIFSVLLSLFLFSCNEPSANPTKISIEEIGQQLLILDDNVQKDIALTPLDSRGEEKIVPRTINDDGSLRVVAGHDWTSGFYPGVMWYGERFFLHPVSHHVWYASGIKTNRRRSTCH